MLSSAQGRPEEQISSISPSFLVRWFLEYGSTHLPSRLLVLNVQRLTFQRLYDTLCSGVGVSERQGLPCVHCISPETGTQQLSKPHQVIQPLVPLLPPGGRRQVLADCHIVLPPHHTYSLTHPSHNYFSSTSSVQGPF